MSHTQGKLSIHPSSINAEPFVVSSDTQGEYIAFSQWIADGEKIICDVSMNTAKGGWPKAESVLEAKANARRLVACWNACDGMPTDLLEQIPGVVGATLPYHQLVAQRNELLDTLKGIANANPKNWDAPLNDTASFQQWAQSRARAAIEKVKV